MRNDHYKGRTASLTSKHCSLYIYSTNIGTEYFKYGIYSPFFSHQNAVFFRILTYLVLNGDVMCDMRSCSLLLICFYLVSFQTLLIFIVKEYGRLNGVEETRLRLPVYCEMLLHFDSK